MPLSMSYDVSTHSQKNNSLNTNSNRKTLTNFQSKEYTADMCLLLYSSALVNDYPAAVTPNDAAVAVRFGECGEGCEHA